MSKERICETRKHEELNGCNYPCYCCAGLCTQILGLAICGSRAVVSFVGAK